MGRRSIVTIRVAEVEKRRMPSKHYVYVIRVTWSDGSSNSVYRRYSRFFDFQNDLLDKFPDQAGKSDPNKRIIPFLPGKKFFGRSHIREVAEKRLKPIDEYCQSLIKLPSEIAESEEVLDFFEVEQEDIEPIKHRKSSRKPKGHKISGPKLLEQYVALADYTPQGKGEIPLRQGISIEVAEKTETGWWFVTAEDEQGWVPSTYLQRVDGREDPSTEISEPGQEEEYVCSTPFTAEGPDEIGLEIGAIVLVFEKNLQGWWKVRYNRQEGFVPAAYLSKVKTEKVTSVQTESNRLSQGVQVVSCLSEVSEYFKPMSKKSPVKQPPPRTNSLPRGSGPLAPSSPHIRVKEYVTIDSFHSDSMEDGISFSAGENVKVLEKSPSGWWYVEIEGHEGWAPAAYIQQLPETPAESDSGESVDQRDSSSLSAVSGDVFEEDSDSDSDSSSSQEDPPTSLHTSLMAKLAEKSGGGSRPSDTPPAPPAGAKSAGKSGLPPTPAKPSVTAESGSNGSATPGKPQTAPKLNTSGLSSVSKPSVLRPKPPANKPALNRSSGEDEEDFDNVSSSGTPKLKVNHLTSALKAKFEESGTGFGGVRNTKPHPASKPSPPSKPINVRISASTSPSNSGDFRSHKPEPPAKARKPPLATPKTQYRASAIFEAENTGEVNLRKGSHVSVLQTDDSGWWLVECEGVEGWAPASYLEPEENNTPVTTLNTQAPYTDGSPQSNSLMDEISSKFGAKLKPVQKPSPPSGFRTNGSVSQSPSSALLTPGKKPSAGTPPTLPIKPKSGAASKGRLPPVPPQKPSYTS